VTTQVYQLEGKRIWVAGHNGMVGDALMRRLNTESGVKILTADRQSLDLTRQKEVEDWTRTEKPDVVFLAAAKVGGILANDQNPADFLYQNLMIESNIIHASYLADVEKLLFLGSSCIYPKYADQPITEDSLLTGSLEPTNKWYAIAKIAGITLCQAYQRQHGSNFISAMPSNLYGPNDNFDLQSSHVIPALIRKTVNAKNTDADHIELWGTGTPRREFLHVDDCADALVFLMKHYSGTSHINVGSGGDVTIKELAQLICDVIGYTGAIKLDPSKPDGTPRKLMSNKKLEALGWASTIDLTSGLRSTIDWYMKHHA